MELRAMPSYQLLRNELENHLNNIEALIFSESKLDNPAYNSEKKYSYMDLLVFKRNTVKRFIELPDNLLELLDIDKQG